MRAAKSRHFRADKARAPAFRAAPIQAKGPARAPHFRVARARAARRGAPSEHDAEHGDEGPRERAEEVGRSVAVEGHADDGVCGRGTAERAEAASALSARAGGARHAAAAGGARGGRPRIRGHRHGQAGCVAEGLRSGSGVMIAGG